MKTDDVTGEVTKCPHGVNDGACKECYLETEVPCQTHPDAPHGFDRNASHNADRYVCECEGWEPDVDNSAHKAENVYRNVDNVTMSKKRVHKSDKSVHEPVAVLAVSPSEAAKIIGLDVSTLEKDRRLGHLGIPFVPAGRRIVYRLADLKDWLEERKQITINGA